MRSAFVLLVTVSVLPGLCWRVWPEDLKVSLLVSDQQVMEYQLPDCIVMCTNQGKNAIQIGPVSGAASQLGVCSEKDGRLVRMISSGSRDRDFEGPYNLAPGHTVYWRVHSSRAANLMSDLGGDNELLLRSFVGRYTGESLLPSVSPSVRVSVKGLNRSQKENFEELCRKARVAPNWHAMSTLVVKCVNFGVLDTPELARTLWLNLLIDAKAERDSAKVLGERVAENAELRHSSALRAFIAAAGDAQLSELARSLTKSQANVERTDAQLIEMFDTDLTLSRLFGMLYHSAFPANRKLSEDAMRLIAHGIPVFVDEAGEPEDFKKIVIPGGYKWPFRKVSGDFRDKMETLLREASPAQRDENKRE